MILRKTSSAPVQKFKNRSSVFLIAGVIIFITLFSIPNEKLFSQPTLEWAKHYSFESGFNNYVVDMVLDRTGNIYVMGYVHYSEENQDLLLIKYDESGNLKWGRKYTCGDSSAIYPAGIVLDNAENVIVSSTCRKTINNKIIFCFLTIKYDKSGDTLWARNYNCQLDTVSWGRAGILSSDKSNNIFVTGICQSGTYSYLAPIIKYNESGGTERIVYVNGGGVQVLNDAANNLYFAGGNSNGQESYKYNSNGNTIWFARDTIFATGKILLDKKNNYFLGGQYYNNILFEEIAVLKYDSLGNRKWLKTHNQISESQRDLFKDFVLDSSGNIYVTGISAHQGQIGWDYTTIKYNENGDSLWVRIFNPVLGSDDAANSITLDKSGNVIVTGRSNNNSIGSKIATVIYNNDGFIKHVLYYDNNLPFSNHEGKKITTDYNNHIVIAGNSMNNTGFYDIVVLKYSQVIGINQISPEVPSITKLFQNYPNPFNPVTNFRYQIPYNAFVSLKIYDITGKEITTLINEEKSAGTYIVSFNAADLATGIYYYNFRAGNNFNQTKKLLLLK